MDEERLELLQKLHCFLANQRRAACRGSDTAAFCPERGASFSGALAFCERCEVREECDYALSTGSDNVVHGIWGGLSTRARRDARRKHLPARQVLDGLDDG